MSKKIILGGLGILAIGVVYAATRKEEEQITVTVPDTALQPNPGGGVSVQPVNTSNYSNWLNNVTLPTQGPANNYNVGCGVIY